MSLAHQFTASPLLWGRF